MILPIARIKIFQVLFEKELGMECSAICQYVKFNRIIVVSKFFYPADNQIQSLPPRPGFFIVFSLKIIVDKTKKMLIIKNLIGALKR
jgi:hypothetical protein